MTLNTPTYLKQEFIKRLEILAALANMIALDALSNESFNIHSQMVDLDRQIKKLQEIMDKKDFRGY